MITGVSFDHSSCSSKDKYGLNGLLITFHFVKYLFFNDRFIDLFSNSKVEHDHYLKLMKFTLKNLLSDKALKSFSELCEEQFYNTDGSYN